MPHARGDEDVHPVRVMIERGKKKTVASAFDWPGWDRSATSEEGALAVLAGIDHDSQRLRGSPGTSSARPGR